MISLLDIDSVDLIAYDTQEVEDTLTMPLRIVLVTAQEVLH